METLTLFIHIDMDAYYAQAEQKKLAIPLDKPVCARQWNSLIAVNYPARDKGIKRGMLAEAAQKLCPDVCNEIHLLPHVDTFRVVNGEIRFSSINDKYKPHNQYEEKVTLKYYRDESKEIFKIFKRYADEIEKCGTDEAYIQITQDKIQHYPAQFEGIVLGSTDQQISPQTQEEELIAKASQLVAEIRKKVWEEAQYRCSAGISFNKMLAKLASGANKPNAQTIILGRFLPDCIKPFRISKIRGFGGKIQQAFNEINIQNVGEAQDLPIVELQRLFKDQDQVAYIQEKLRGFDEEKLKTDKEFKTKSILSIKNFKKIDKPNYGLLAPILQLLIYDLSMRVQEFYEDEDLVPSIMTITYYNTEIGSHQKSEQLNLRLPVISFRQQIEEVANSLLKQISPNQLFPCNNLGIGAKQFQKISKDQEYKFNMKTFIQQANQRKEEKEKEEFLLIMDQQMYPEKYQKCKQCDQLILRENMSEHEDFHEALNLDMMLNPNRKQYLSRQKENSEQFVSKATPAKKKSSQHNTLQQYFMKKQ